MGSRLAASVFLLAFVACIPSNNEGSEGGACFENDTCNEGLECKSDLCVAKDDDPTEGFEGGPCFANSTCNEGLSCLSDTCVDSPVLDAGEPSDSGTAADAGSPPDAGPTLDAGSLADSGAINLDAGVPGDGGATADASSFNDSGLSDDSGAPLDSGIVQCMVAGETITDPLENASSPDGGSLDLACFSSPLVVGAGSTTVLEGCVNIFGIGNRAKVGLKVAVYSAEQNLASEAPAHGEVDVAIETNSGPLQAQAQNCEFGGFFQISNIPTHEPLIIKTYDSSDLFARAAVTTYEYFVFLLDSDIASGAINRPTQFIYKTTYESIPTLGGQFVDGQEDLFDGVGRGIIAATAFDCAGSSVSSVSATTDLFDADTAVVYFDADPDDPTPDLSRSSTNSDGQYWFLNAAAQPGGTTHHVAAGMRISGQADCQLHSEASIKVFPDSVSIFANHHGTLPVVLGSVDGGP
jgi:hypothetical protein